MVLEEIQKKVHELREKQQEFIRRKDNISYQINTIDEKIKKVQEIEKDHKGQVEELKKQVNASQPPASSQSSFNPAISLILMGRYASFENDPEIIKVQDESD